MPFFVCATCGIQHAESAEPPRSCPICEDERQWVPEDGQRWTTLEELRADHRNRIEEQEPGLTGIGTEPSFAIGQRALLVRSPAGNVLWDCITLVDDQTVSAVEALGGVSAIAISHPHYYSGLVEWSRAFGNVPVYLHEADARWVLRPDPCVVPWSGETHELGPGLTLVRLGGHFDGGAVLHWAEAADGKGALLTGDIVQVIPDITHVSFMYSYPNLIPLPAPAIRRIADALEPFAFDRIYGAWWERVVPEDGKDVVRRSAERYVRWITSAA
jgi:glyoxylase-like metal-dependent hydrolase (beta-lactamase superfamily II)